MKPVDCPMGEKWIYTCNLSGGCEFNPWVRQWNPYKLVQRKFYDQTWQKTEEWVVQRLKIIVTKTTKRRTHQSIYNDNFSFQKLQWKPVSTIVIKSWKWNEFCVYWIEMLVISI